MSEPMMWLLVRGVWETLAMTFVSGFFGFVIGLPVGVLLYVTRPGQIIANAKLYRTSKIMNGMERKMFTIAEMVRYNFALLSVHRLDCRQRLFR